MARKLSNAKSRLAAKLWAAKMLIHTDIDGLDFSVVSLEDAIAITKEVQKIGRRLIKGYDAWSVPNEANEIIQLIEQSPEPNV